MKDEKWAYEIEGKLEIPYRYFAGEFCSRFLTTLRDDRKILGCRCSGCGKVFMPPRSSCEVCFSKIEEWVEVGPAGTVTSWTVVRYKEPHLPEKPPYILALIRLDGADTSLAHIVKGVKPEDMKSGMRVEAVFADERKASILDIACFKPSAVPERKPSPRKAPVKKKAVKRKPARPKPEKKAAKKKPARKKAKKVVRKKKSKPAKRVTKKKAARKPARKKIRKRVVRRKARPKKRAVRRKVIKRKAAGKRVAKGKGARKRR